MIQNKKLLSAHLDDLLYRGQAWLFLQKHALYGLSATRILIGVAVFGLLVSDFTFRHVLWGAGSFWAQPFREHSELGLLVNIFSSSNPALFTLQYVLLMAIAVAVILGWYTRFNTALLALGLTALVKSTDILGDQGDNIARIGLTLMVFMTTNAHWSFDARRRRIGNEQNVTRIRQRVWFSLPVLPHWMTTLLHNAALMVLGSQLFILYTASALFK